MAAMTAEQAVEAAKNVTFEQAWAFLQDVGRKQAETSAQIKEVSANIAITEKVVKELSASMDVSRIETDKIIKELSANIGGVNNTLGAWAEEMFAAKLCEKVNVLGYKFTKYGRNIRWTENGKRIMEIDCFLENGDSVMAVETKTNLTTGDVDNHKGTSKNYI